MRKTCIAAATAVVGLIASSAMAQFVTATYDWEDGKTLLSSYTAGADNLIWENSTEQAFTGSASLKLTEDPLSGTPEAHIAYIENLVNGDTITAGFWVYDVTVGTSPSGRVWANYSTSGDLVDCILDSYNGSASGNFTYSDGTGWSYLEWTWIYDEGNPIRDGLTIQARIYSDVDANVIYIDDLYVEVTSASGIATITTPGTSPCDPPTGYNLEVSDLVAGTSGYFLVTGATPNTMQYLVYSLRGLGSTFVPQLNVTLDLKAPTLADNGKSDAAGEILWALPVPKAAKGRTAWLQAAEFEATTNVVEEFID